MPKNEWNFDISENLLERLTRYLEDNLHGPALVAYRYRQYVDAMNWANIMQIKVDLGEELYPGAIERFNQAQRDVEKTFTRLRATCQDLGI